MTNLDFFKEEFERLSTDGYLGDPNGERAYGYVRVSSSEQAEEGRSGLPRQLMHVHEVAAKHHLKISFEFMFAEDHTGFEFRDRPVLGLLRQEFKRSDRRAHTLVIEHLDRLSRNADWHQGFLLDEMHEYNLKVLFWKTFSSRIERAVMGAISQEGMEQEKQRMQEGRILKAQSGRVTAKTRAFGYIFVDSEGKETPKAKKETYYAPHPQEAEIIRLIFEKIAHEGMGSVALANYLQERFPPPGKYAYWQPTQILLFVRNPLYKGQFIANRTKEVKVPARKQSVNQPVKLVKKKMTRPEEEWITVPVPPLISPEVWEMANRIIDKNAEMAPRNAKLDYLLTGILICATCGGHYAGSSRYYRWKNSDKKSHYCCYRCCSQANLITAHSQAIHCTQGQINREKLEAMVWYCICKALHEPQLLLEHFDRKFETEEHQGIAKQIAFLERQLREKDVEDEKLYKAYLADVFDAKEYAARRDLVKQAKTKLEKELSDLYGQQVKQEDREAMRMLIKSVSAKAVAEGLHLDMPFEFKKQMLKLLVDRIVLNTTEKWFRIEGVLSGTYSTDGSIGNIPVGRG